MSNAAQPRFTEAHALGRTIRIRSGLGVAHRFVGGAGLLKVAGLDEFAHCGGVKSVTGKVVRTVVDDERDDEQQHGGHGYGPHHGSPTGSGQVEHRVDGHCKQLEDHNHHRVDGHHAAALGGGGHLTQIQRDDGGGEADGQTHHEATDAQHHQIRADRADDGAGDREGRAGENHLAGAEHVVEHSGEEGPDDRAEQQQGCDDALLPGSQQPTFARADVHGDQRAGECRQRVAIQAAAEDAEYHHQRGVPTALRRERGEVHIIR